MKHDRWLSQWEGCRQKGAELLSTMRRIERAMGYVSVWRKAQTEGVFVGFEDMETPLVDRFSGHVDRLYELWDRQSKELRSETTDLIRSFRELIETLCRTIPPMSPYASVLSEMEAVLCGFEEEYPFGLIRIPSFSLCRMAHCVPSLRVGVWPQLGAERTEFADVSKCIARPQRRCRRVGEPLCTIRRGQCVRHMCSFAAVF